MSRDFKKFTISMVVFCILLLTVSIGIKSKQKSLQKNNSSIQQEMNKSVNGLINKAFDETLKMVQ